ncbi:MAG: DUF2452 domain-containing protein [Chitinophagaceae bacterium]
MLELHHFSFSWQLIPEKGIYGNGKRPKSGTLRIRPVDAENKIIVEHQWVDLHNVAYVTDYTCPNLIGNSQDSDLNTSDKLSIYQKSQYDLSIECFNDTGILYKLSFEILPNGHLKLIKEGRDELSISFTHTEFYHKQYSVLPYASSVGTAVIKPTEEGMIRHKALTAMEEQTNMQLDQIRKQIELLAQQAQEIYNRKELSMKIYQAKLSFQPVIGHVYHLYTKKDDSLLLSLVSPKEWGKVIPFEQYHGAVKMLADHTWMEVTE